MRLPKLAPCHPGAHRFRLNRCRPRVTLLASCATIPPACARGKVVLFEFWTTWCKHCEEEAQLVGDIAKEFKGKNRIILAADVLEPDQQVKKYLAGHPRSVPIVRTRDTNLATMYNARVYAISVVVDRDAGERRGARGERGWRRRLRRAGLPSEQNNRLPWRGGSVTKHTYELAASIFGFLGGTVLSLDALFAVRRARSERGKKSVQEAVTKARGVYLDDHDRVLTSTYALQLLFARRIAIAGRIGFGLLTLGFLLDLIGKW